MPQAVERMILTLTASKLISFLGILLAIVFSGEAFVAKSAPGRSRLAHINIGSQRKRKELMRRSDKDTGEDALNNNEKVNAKTWNPLRLAVLKLGLTEPAWTSPWNYQKKEGTFVCAYCGDELFDSNAKYDSGSGWPSFWRTSSNGSVALKREWDGRMECKCGRCDSHLGHVFLDGPTRTQMPQDLVNSIPQTDARSTSNASRLPRYCINGAALRFEENQKN